MTVLLAEDDQFLLNNMSVKLKASGIEVIQAADGMQALEKFNNNHIDICVFDWMMPNLDGITLCKYVKEKCKEQDRYVPVIILTAKVEETAEKEAFEYEADDYLTKPISLSRLETRVKHWENLKSETSSKTIKCGNLSLNEQGMQVMMDSEEIELSITEYRILALLLKNKGLLVSTSKLLTEIYGDDKYNDTKYLMMCVSQLRTKINHSNCEIRNVRGGGYLICLKPNQ